jgi:hypothetical protein
MQVEFRDLVQQLKPEQIIPTAIRYRVIKRTVQRGSDLSDSNISDNILSVTYPSSLSSSPLPLLPPASYQRTLKPQDSLTEQHSHPSLLSESSDILEWHRHRFTTVDMKGQRNLYSSHTSSTSTAAGLSTSGATSAPVVSRDISSPPPQCLIS